MTTGKVNCLKCRHFIVTWNPKFPRGCRLYGFKSVTLPSAEVFKATGEDCIGFANKELKKR